MIEVRVSGLDEIKEVVRKVKDWADSGYQITMTRAVDQLAIQVKNDMLAGLETETSPMASLRKSTLEGPVSRDTNPTRRDYYGDTPLVATGALVNDIVGDKIDKNTYEVGAYSPENDAKLRSNAKRTHSGSPFAGDTPKVSRDPLQVSEKRIDIVENRILADLEVAIGI